MKYRTLHIVWSVFWGVAAVLLLVLWVQSYESETIVQGVIGSERLQGSSEIGRLELLVFPNASSRNFPDTSWSISKFPLVLRGEPRDMWMFGRLLTGEFAISAPHWFLALACTLLGTTSWIRRLPWPKRFSLRTMLIATTLVAVVLGLIVWAVNK